MIILQAGAKGCRYRQPLADVHGVVLFIVIPPVSKVSRVGPIVLDHIDPQRENSYSYPHHQRKLQTSNQLPEEKKTKGLCKDCENRIRSHPESPGLQNLVTRQIIVAFVGHHAAIHRSPKTIAGKFVGISLMVGILMMQSMTIYPGDRIHIESEGVVHDRDSFHEPFFIVERPVRDS